MGFYRSSFGRSALALAGSFFTPLALAAPLPNAWQITDNSAGSGSALNYVNILSTSGHQAATNRGFRFTVNARFLTNFGSSKSVNMSYGLGSRRFVIWWDLDDNGDLTGELDDGFPITLTSNGTGSAFYHTHEIVYNPASGRASYLMDGQAVTTNWQSSPNASAAGRISWGAGSSPGRGRMNFNGVAFEITNTIVAGYDAGTAGDPPLAPDPAAQGWILSAGAGPTTASISPDNVLLPATPTAATLAATGVEPHQATLSGLINPGGLAATAWFEWGTDTSYGNTTPPQFLRADTNTLNFSQTISGLAKGFTCHYRCVLNTALGVVYGADCVFTTPPVFTLTSLADSGNGSLRQSIAHANSGDIITVGTNGTITLTSGELLITNNLTIVGSGPARLAITTTNGPRAFSIASGVTISISGLTIRDITQGSRGAGIYNQGMLAIGNCVLSGNSAGSSSGGAVYNEGTMTVTGSSFSGNSGYYGGAIFNVGILTVTDSTLSGNSASNEGGGAIDNRGSLTVAKSAISDNRAARIGGGILNSDTLSVSNSTLSGNVAGGQFVGEGGALYNGSGSLTLVNSTLCGNSAGEGGAIYNSVVGSLTVANSTISGNLARYVGGGLYVRGGTNTLNNCTLSGNSAAFSSGGLFQHSDGMSALTNTIVAGNSAPDAPNLSGSFTSVTTANSLVSGDPLLAALGNYGGGTQTMPPLAGSPAIDFGSDSITNILAAGQRGYPRRSGAHVDIGAAEAQAVSSANRPLLSNPGLESSGALRFSFMNFPYADFTVLASTNVALPSSQWTRLGLATQGETSLYQFTDPTATNYAVRFYQLASP
jgi:hypothetical protein